MSVKESAFSGDLKADAAAKVAAISESQAFPIRFGRRQCGMAFSFVLPLAILFVSYHHLLLSAAARQERQDVKAQAVPVQHVLQILAKNPQASKEETELTKQLQRLQRDLERGRLDRQSAKQRADEISQEADRLMRTANESTKQSLNSAENALDREKADSKLPTQASPEQEKADLAASKMSPEQLKQAAQQPVSQQQLDALSKKIADLEKKLADSAHLTPQERDALSKELAQAKQQQYQLKLSEAAQKMLQRLQSNPEYQKLMKMMQKLQQNSQQLDQKGQPSLSQADIDKMQQELEELAKELKTDKDVEEYIKKLEEAMKEAKKAGNMSMVASLMSMLNMGGAPDTTPGPPNGAHINMSDKELKGQGKTHEEGVQADQKPNGQPSPYVELRGMAKLTGPSTIPLLRDIPASTRKAEEAISKQRIPKEHQERVKKYFESLEGKS